MPTRSPKSLVLRAASFLFLTGCISQILNAPADIPLNVDNITLAWTYNASSAFNHPPMRVDDVILSLPSEGPLTALDLEGQLLWQFSPSERLWDRSLATDGEKVFVGTAGGKLIALNIQNGEKAWEVPLGIEVQVAPLVANGTLYVPTTFVGPGLPGDPYGKAKLFALSTKDGRQIWEFESENFILQTPAIFDDRLYMAGSYKLDADVDEGGPMRMYAISAVDGSLIWIYESLDGFTKKVFAHEDHVAYIAYQDFITGVDAATGEMVWRMDTGNWVPTMSGYQDMVFFGSANTVVHAINIDTGEYEWEFNIPEGTFNYVLGAPVLEKDQLYFLTQQGSIIVLDAASGKMQWEYQTGISSRYGLTIEQNSILIGDAEGIIYYFTPKTSE